MTQDQEQLLASVFRLGDAHFAIPASSIQEVVQLGRLTPVHHAPSCVRGIRNLGGHIVTVIDLKTRLGLGFSDTGPECRIVMVNSKGELLGLLVEAVGDTTLLDERSVTVAQPGLDDINGAAILGIYSVGEKLVALLDHEVVLDTSSSPCTHGSRQ